MNKSTMPLAAANLIFPNVKYPPCPVLNQQGGHLFVKIVAYQTSNYFTYSKLRNWERSTDL